MKKWICLLLAAALLLGSAAFAENEQPYEAFVLTLKDVTVEVNGQAYPLAPQLQITLGMTADRTDGFLTLELSKDGETLAAFWAEEMGNGEVGRYGYSVGETCGVATPGYYLHVSLMMLAGLTVDEDSVALSSVLDQAGALLFAEDRSWIAALLAGQGAEILEESDTGCVFHLAAPGMAFTGVLDCQIMAAMEKPFDLSGRQEAAYSPFHGLFGTEGFAEAEQELTARLMQEESLANLFAALQPMLTAE